MRKFGLISCLFTIVALLLGTVAAYADVKNTIQVTDVECSTGTLQNGAASGLITDWIDALHSAIATSN